MSNNKWQQYIEECISHCDEYYAEYSVMESFSIEQVQKSFDFCKATDIILSMTSCCQCDYEVPQLFVYEGQKKVYGKYCKYCGKEGLKYVRHCF